MQSSSIKKTSVANEANKNQIIQIWSMQTQIAINFQSDKIHPKCIFLVGDTKVGKTTLLYYLSGLKLKLIEDSVKKTKQMEPQQLYENAIICNHQSTTEIPNIFSKIQGETAFSLIDMPGMNDNRFVSLVSNIYTFLQIFDQTQKIKQVHIALVISQEMFDAQDIKQSLREFTQHFDFEVFQKAKHISLIFTKTQDDIDSLKEKFFEYLECIKEQIEEEEEDKNVVKLIDILRDCNSQQELAYCFAKEEPDQKMGQKIALDIVERNHFMKKGDSSLLNQNIMNNIFVSSKLRSANFESNFIGIINQLERTFESSLEMVADLLKILHANYVKDLFTGTNILEEVKEQFFEKHSELFLAFKINWKIQSGINKEQFIEMLSVVFIRFKNEKKLCSINRAFRQLLDCKNQGSIESTSEGEQLKLSFLRDLTKFLGETVLRIEEGLKKIDKKSNLVDSLENMGCFYEWISNCWFEALSKVYSLSKITEKLKEMTERLEKSSKKIRKDMESNLSFWQIFLSFSQKPLEQDDQDSSDQETDLMTPKKIEISSGPTLNQLQEKFMKPRWKKIDDLIKKYESGQQNDNFSAEEIERKVNRVNRVRRIVENIQGKILKLNKMVDQNEAVSSFPLLDKEVSDILFRLKNLRHIQLLESVLGNFLNYISFFGIILNYVKFNDHQVNQIKSSFKDFIQNICELLEECGIYETSLVIYLFSNNLEMTLKAVENAIKYNQLEPEFIKKLISNIESLTEQNGPYVQVDSIQSQKMIQIVTKCFNQLTVHFCSTRKEQQDYQSEYIRIIGKIESLERKMTPFKFTHHLKLNFSALDISQISMSNLSKKVQELSKKISSSKVPLIQKTIRSKIRSKKYPTPATPTPAPSLHQTIKIIQNLTPQPSQ